MLHFGIPSGHDFEFHVNSWIEVVNQWHSGVIYPHWAAGAHYGFGEARFIFYPPGSWLLGSLLGLVLPWGIVPGTFLWLALTAAGCAMFLLARSFVSYSNAIVAAVLYAINPYHLVIVYWRSAYAELLASFLLPLLLLFVLRADKQGKKIVVPLAFLVAAAWLANDPAAVMVNYSLALIVTVTAIVQRSPRVLLYGAAAVLLGAGLAGFYLVPVAYEQHWVNLSEVFSTGVRPQENFLFTYLPDVDHNKFNLLVSFVAVAGIGLFGVLIYLSRSWRRRQPALWWTTLAWGTVSALLMLSPTFIFWQYLPKLRFVQLPWRWLLCLNVPLALFSALIPGNWKIKSLASAVMIGLILFVCVKVQPPWWDSRADLAEMRDNIVEGTGYDGVDEYVPAGIDPYEIKQGAPEIVEQDGSRDHAHILNWGPESKILITDQSHPSTFLLRLFRYPAWQAEVNGHPLQAQSDDNTGQIVLPLPAGENRVRIYFARTWDRPAGVALSFAALVLLIALTLLFRRQESLA